MKHLNFYNNENFVNQYRGLAFPYVGYKEDDITTPEYEGKTYVSNILDSYITEYFTITALHDGTMFAVYHPDKDIIYEYSTDKVTWHELHTSNDDMFNASEQINAGEKFYVKANIPANSLPKYSEINHIYGGSNYTCGGIGAITCGTTNGECTFNVSGNIMSLLYGDDFIGKQLTNEYEAAFYLLLNYADVIDASMLVLPQTTNAGCYCGMFQGCTSLVNAPKLQATTLADSCYCDMFNGCTSLITVPELSATTLATYCYYRMFQGCTSLINAPELPATELAIYCYCGIFGDCTSLVTAPKLPATTLAGSCYSSMFIGCTSLINAPKLQSTELEEWCYSDMFRGCTSLTTAPVLPATTLTNMCYRNMFYGCTSLSNITMLATDISANNCLSNWVKGVAPTGIFYKHPDMNDLLINNYNGIPFGWTLQDWATNPYEREYLTITAYNDDLEILRVNMNPTSDKIPVYYSFDKKNWAELYTTSYANNLSASIPTNTQEILLHAGQSVYLKGDIKPNTLVEPEVNYDGEVNIYYTCGFCTFDFYSNNGYFTVSGNIMSLIHGDNFVGKKDLTEYPGVFYRLFANTSNLTDISNLVLPATTLSSCCYAYMFDGCNDLGGSSPVLPAPNLAPYCYVGMLQGTYINKITMLFTDIPEDAHCFVDYHPSWDGGEFIHHPDLDTSKLWCGWAGPVPCYWYVDGIECECAS